VDAPSSLLSRILARKREEVEAARRVRPLASVKAQAVDAPPPRDFAGALRGAARRPAVIAEVKRRSPSAGELRPGADVVPIAQQYMLAGAAAVSVLTEESFFGGSLADLTAVRAGTRVPTLRKDFLIDPYDLWRARAAGADAVLLIVTALEDGMLAELHGLAAELGMAALVEAHSEAEVQRALAVRPRLLGINHRDLATLSMDLSLSARMRPAVPADVLLVAESGIRSAADVVRMRDAGVDAILVGEALLSAPDPGAACRELVMACS
jgi:indole-3-glycerol phosphate synthase